MNKIQKMTAIIIGSIAIGAFAVKKLLDATLQKAYNLIKQLEGRDGYLGNGNYKAVGDITGVATIGYGSTIYPSGQRVKLGDTCTEAQALNYMQTEAKNYYQQIQGATKVKLTAGQAAALTSFAYNVGITGLLGSTLWKKLQAGEDKNTVAAQFDAWVYAGGKVVQGLANRRQEEKKVFLS